MTNITDLVHYIPHAILSVLALLVLINCLVYIPNNKIGVMEKLIGRKGSLKSGIIALNGEAGFQPKVLRGGWHLLVPFQYRIHRMPLVMVPQGTIGYVYARGGEELQPDQALASNIDANNFEDVVDFFAKGGQKGPQRKILREGTYAINPAQFTILTAERMYFLEMDPQDRKTFENMSRMIYERMGFTPLRIRGEEDMIGIVTVQEGPSLASGEIIAPAIEAEHDSFQDPEKFLGAGGFRGRQLQVLIEGTYYINRLFATVELVPKTVVEVGYVGVVVSYTGKTGSDVSGVDYKHGELVQRGCRGVWADPLLPGKYAFNTYAGKIIHVPTTNFMLKWNRQETGAHKFDENLSEISLITKDAFEPTLPLSVVVHIDYHMAPLVIQRFGDIKRLVDQTLDPLVSAYFKNVGQLQTLIELLQSRGSIQEQAKVEMKGRFALYNLELLEVLIGTPASKAGDKQIETILDQLRGRQIAEEKVETYQRQERAAVKERELREAEARAGQQAALTASAIAIEVQTNQGKADYARAQQQASQIQALAAAEAEKMRLLGEGEAQKIKALAAAEAERVEKVGLAQALATQKQVEAYGGPKFQLTQQVMDRFAQAIESSGVEVVPRVVVGGDGNQDGMNGNIMQALLTMLLSDRMEGSLAPKQAAAPAPQTGTPPAA